MRTEALYPRLVEPRLTEALQDSPVVLIHGPRQCGKTTLAQFVYAPNYLKWGDDYFNWGDQRLAWGQSPTHRDYAYISFDDQAARAGAKADPVGFVADLPERVILDEIQRVPELFLPLKVAIDRRRVPGRFILTGSANVLLIPTLGDSLAGRLEIVRLHPLAQSELEAWNNPPQVPQSGSGFLENLFGKQFKIRQTGRLGREIIDRIVAGGFPAALARPTARRQANWYRDYVETQIQRDIRDMARIRTPEAMSRLLLAAASQTGRLFNLSALASPFQLSRPTIDDYVRLLERLFLVERLPPWQNNRLKRLIKTPKLHIGDSSLAAALLGANPTALAADRALLGQLLETFVFQELRRQASWYGERTRLFHFRDKDGAEVDIVIERGAGLIAGVEIKASATISSTDFRGLRKLASAAGRQFAAGVVLFDGETSVRFAENLYAVPLSQLWEAH